ncbi:IQ-domain [Ancistrocladus abbreviatus]
MAVTRSWFGTVKKKFRIRSRLPFKNIIIIHNNTSITNEEDNRTSCVQVKDQIANLNTNKDQKSAVIVGAVSRKEEDDIKAAVEAAPPPPPPAAVAVAPVNRDPSVEEKAATKIQAMFRGHLARRMLRALRSLVKLQAVVRGVCVRSQARLALHSMHALVRLQARVRARQLLRRSSGNTI